MRLFTIHGLFVKLLEGGELLSQISYRLPAVHGALLSSGAHQRSAGFCPHAEVESGVRTSLRSKNSHEWVLQALCRPQEAQIAASV